MPPKSCNLAMCNVLLKSDGGKKDSGEEKRLNSNGNFLNHYLLKIMFLLNNQIIMFSQFLSCMLISLSMSVVIV